MIKSFWHQSDNFGDKLTPYILQKLGVEFAYTEKGIEEEHHIMCGSILTACNEHSIIWGAGIAQEYPVITPKHIAAVRGIHTRNYLLSQNVDCPEVYGDPAMILPLLYQPPATTKKMKTGIVPHVINYPGMKQEIKDCWDLNRPVEETINFICSCDEIITSSLHAAITAWAYGIPHSFIFSPNVIGCHFKYNDFADTIPLYNKVKFIQSFPVKL